MVAKYASCDALCLMGMQTTNRQVARGRAQLYRVHNPLSSALLIASSRIERLLSNFVSKYLSLKILMCYYRQSSLSIYWIVALYFIYRFADSCVKYTRSVDSPIIDCQYIL